MRIAIADDDPDGLELLNLSLQTPATEICKAATGAELVSLLAERGPFDLIVTDIDMPWMEGLAVLQAARTSGIHTPALFVTGMSHPDLQLRIARLGNAKLMRKPIGILDLRNAVRSLLREG